MAKPRKSRTKKRTSLLPDPTAKLKTLRRRLEKELSNLDRWRRRLFRVTHAYERQHRLVASLQRRVAKLEAG